MMQTEIQQLELIDGMGKEPARMVSPHVTEAPCAPGRHCAHHCGGDGEPFACCRCGAQFMPVAQG